MKVSQVFEFTLKAAVTTTGRLSPWRKLMKVVKSTGRTAKPTPPTSRVPAMMQPEIRCAPETWNEVDLTDPRMKRGNFVS